MNQVTQHTAATAEESASAAEELAGQASEMKSMVQAFRLTAAGKSKSSQSATHDPESLLSLPASKAAKLQRPNSAWRIADQARQQILFQEENKALSDF